MQNQCDSCNEKMSQHYHFCRTFCKIIRHAPLESKFVASLIEMYDIEELERYRVLKENLVVDEVKQIEFSKTLTFQKRLNKMQSRKSILLNRSSRSIGEEILSDPMSLVISGLREMETPAPELARFLSFLSEHDEVKEDD